MGALETAPLPAAAESSGMRRIALAGTLQVHSEPGLTGWMLLRLTSWPPGSTIRRSQLPPAYWHERTCPASVVIGPSVRSPREAAGAAGDATAGITATNAPLVAAARARNA